MTEYRRIGISDKSAWYANPDGKLCLLHGDTLAMRVGPTGLEYVPSYERNIQLYPGALMPGATDPTAMTAIGTFAGWAFDNDNESKHLVALIPTDWDGASDMSLDIWWIPESGAAMSTSETVKWDATWRTKAALAVADGGTAGVMTTTYTQSGAGTDKQIIKTSLTVDYDDADQPLVAGSLLSILLDRDMTTDTYATDANLVMAMLRYQSNGLSV